jgi:hypothetical protein
MRALRVDFDRPYGGLIAAVCPTPLQGWLNPARISMPATLWSE